MPEVASKKYIDQKIDKSLNEVKNRLIEEIRLANKPEYIGLEEVAQELGYKSKQTASKWLKREDRGIQILWDQQPIRVNRNDFYNYLRSL